MRRAEAVIARIAACDDIDEHARLVQEAERCTREAQCKIRAAGGDVEGIIGAHTEAETAPEESYLEDSAGAASEEH
jgi:hypothetical protein